MIIIDNVDADKSSSLSSSSSPSSLQSSPSIVNVFLCNNPPCLLLSCFRILLLCTSPCAGHARAQFPLLALHYYGAAFALAIAFDIAVADFDIPFHIGIAIDSVFDIEK